LRPGGSPRPALSCFSSAFTALESYILTPILQRHALRHSPATLFAFQILLGVVFGIWGLALALPLMAIVKVMIDYFKADEIAADAVGGLRPPTARPSTRRGQHRLGMFDLGRRREILPDQARAMPQNLQIP